MKKIRSFLLMMLAFSFLLSCSMQGDNQENNSRVSGVQASQAIVQNGKLSVSGSNIVNEAGQPVYLKGMSLFWSQWSGQFWNPSVVQTLADDWGCTVVRAAMGIEHGGYIENPQVEKAKVKTIVDAAVNEGIYVIIDWHDHDAINHQDQAIAFFQEMAREYKNTPNVMFEIFNEPDYESWAQVKQYSEAVIAAIRAEGAENIIIVGTTTWAQGVDIASNDPITGYSNIAYSLHFYAASPEHQDPLRQRAQTAINNGLPMFATEWGTCEYTGNGTIDTEQSQVWIDFLEANNISWCNWSLFDKPEAASALKPGSSTTGPWSESDLTVSGKFIKDAIGGTIIKKPSISPSSSEFDLKPVNSDNILVTMNPEGETLQGIKNGSQYLFEGTDYAIQGNNITIRKEYLSTLSEGTTLLTFDFSGNTDPILSVRVFDSSNTTSDLSVEFFNGNTIASSNTISLRFRLENEGNSPIALSDVDLNYFFTKDVSSSISVTCDHAGGNLNGSYNSITSSVVGTVNPATGADTDSVANITFTSSAGSLAPGGYVEIQLRVTNSTWNNFDQSDDYSFNSSSSNYSNWNYVTALINDQLVSGINP